MALQRIFRAFGDLFRDLGREIERDTVFIERVGELSLFFSRMSCEGSPFDFHLGGDEFVLRLDRGVLAGSHRECSGYESVESGEDDEVARPASAAHA
jgi:hypothetical protein